DVDTFDRGIRRQVIDVQLERVSSGLLDQPRVIGPAAYRSAIQTAHYWNLNSLFGPSNQVQIFVRTNVVALHIGEIADRFRIAVDSLRQVMVDVITIETGLLFKQ